MLLMENVIRKIESCDITAYLTKFTPLLLYTLVLSLISWSKETKIYYASQGFIRCNLWSKFGQRQWPPVRILQLAWVVIFTQLANSSFIKSIKCFLLYCSWMIDTGRSSFWIVQGNNVTKLTVDSSFVDL